MDFPISGAHINPVLLIAVGFLIGVLGGLFGVGGSFLAGPSLLLMGLHANFTVGTDLAHIVGKSIVAAKKHWTLGNVDLKLGGIMAVGSVAGAEIGASLIQWLKRTGQVDSVVNASYVVVLLGISTFMGWEGIATLRLKRQQKAEGKRPQNDDGTPGEEDENAFGGLAQRLHGLHLPPMVGLPTSKIPQVSLWLVLLVALLCGVLSGFLGGGAGYVRMPAMVYLLGVPTHIAVGTDLFEIIISAGYGTFSHALKGNVDFPIALVMHTGAAIGAQIGVLLTQYLKGSGLRLAFVPLPVLGAVLLIFHHMHK